MKYVIMKYLRISSEDIDIDELAKYESDSIVNQRALLDDFISKMPEFDNCEILEMIDDGHTGTNFDRPGVQEVLDFAQRGKIHCIVVKDLSRFGRNYLEVGDYLEQIFPKWGVRFISVNDMYDSVQYNGTTGGISIAFRNLIAELYSRDLSEKIRSAKNTLNMNGKICASYAFFGYMTDPQDRHKLVIDEPAAEIVRLIFTLAEQGISSLQIAKNLNKDGVPTANERKKELGLKRNWLRNGKMNLWQTACITRMLRDERYTGKHIYGKMRRVELGKKIVKSVPQSEWIVVPDAFPAIITDEQFLRVREIMKAKTKGNTNKPLSNSLLFRRKIFCGFCGKALRQIKTKNGCHYYCATPKIWDVFGCMSGKINEYTVTETVLTVLRLHAQSAGDIKSIKAASAELPSTAIANLKGETQNLQRLIEKSNSIKLSLWEKQYVGDISRETFQDENEKLTRQVMEYMEKITELETQIRNLEMESGRENIFIERFGKHIGIQELSREVVDEFIQAIYVYAPDRIEVILNYADDYNRVTKANT